MEKTKLDILLRVEPGSLGPDGLDFVEGFCQVAEKAMQQTRGTHFNWEIVPRYDKSLPEITYFINQKRLSDERIEQWLERLGTNMAEMEESSMLAISNLIDRYLGHKY